MAVAVASDLSSVAEDSAVCTDDFIGAAELPGAGRCRMMPRHRAVRGYSQITGALDLVSKELEEKALVADAGGACELGCSPGRPSELGLSRLWA